MNSPLRLFWWILTPILLIFCLAVLVQGWIHSANLRAFHIDHEVANLQRMNQAKATELQSTMARGEDISALIRESSGRTDLRFTLIDADGLVLADSHRSPSEMDLHGTRPEVLDAKASGEGSSIRFSDTLGLDMVYGALRIEGPNRESIYLRCAKPLEELHENEGPASRRHWTLVLSLVLVLILITSLIAGTVSGHLDRLSRTINAMASGKFTSPLQQKGPQEFQTLALQINDMQEATKERVGSILKQRDQQEAMLTSMKEGIISLDQERRIISINPMARQLLRCPKDFEPIGRDLGEIFRHVELLDSLDALLEQAKEFEVEVILDDLRDVIIQVQGHLIGIDDSSEGFALLVMNDVSDLRRLENMRKNFVANVSHELKTPLTSIRGYAETLMGMPAFSDETPQRFLKRIEHNADRLHQIIEDLLMLSRLEQVGVPMEDLKAMNPKGLVENLVRELPQEWKDQIQCPDAYPEVKVRVHGPLLHQAMFNLVDNAFKYAGDHLSIEVKQRETHLDVSFTDRGPGIPSKHLPRLSQRFYRVDKARSRDQGGTGLGLSIVRHICEAHHGRLIVESEVGRGSTFTISLPLVA